MSASATGQRFKHHDAGSTPSDIQSAKQIACNRRKAQPDHLMHARATKLHGYSRSERTSGLNDERTQAQKLLFGTQMKSRDGLILCGEPLGSHDLSFDFVKHNNPITHRS